MLHRCEQLSLIDLIKYMYTAKERKMIFDMYMIIIDKPMLVYNRNIVNFIFCLYPK